VLEHRRQHGHLLGAQKVGALAAQQEERGLAPAVDGEKLNKL
jgi:hypothetical protein